MAKNSLELAQAFGCLKIPELYAIKTFARFIPSGGVYVNIGVGSGTSSLAVAEESKSIYQHSIDISKGGPLGGLENEINAFRNAGMLDLLPNQILGDSKKIGRKWKTGINMLFIDGDHSYNGCMGDMEVWIPHMLSHSYILIHDYEKDVWPDVTNAVNDYLKTHPSLYFMGVVDTLAIIMTGE